MTSRSSLRHQGPSAGPFKPGRLPATNILPASCRIRCLCFVLQILQEMGELRRNVDSDLAACQASLDEESQADAAARAKYGDDWRVPQSATLAKHLWEKLHSYRWG